MVCMSTRSCSLFASVLQVLVQFDPKNVSNIYARAPFPYFEDVLEIAYDAASHRAFFYTNSQTVDTYNTLTLQPLGRVVLPFRSYPASAFHFDARANGLWFVFPDDGVVDVCYLGADDKSGTLVCAPAHAVRGDFSYVRDASAFDAASRTLAATVNGGPDGNPMLLVWQVDTPVAATPVPLADLCQNMKAVSNANGTVELVCVSFTFNTLARVNVRTGALQPIAELPFLENPNLLTATVHSSSYFAQLYGAIDFTWTEIDVQSGKTVHSSTIPVSQIPELAFCTYIAN